MPFRKARKASIRKTSRAAQRLALTASLVLLGCESLQDAVANGDTRTISLHHVHTGEDLQITYKRNGRYDDEALKKINWVLRDWRRNEEIRMDPHLIDLVWEVHRDLKAKEAIEIICGYRAPQTNAMLRRRSSGVARVSQHVAGKAIDFAIPGVALEDVRPRRHRPSREEGTAPWGQVPRRLPAPDRAAEHCAPARDGAGSHGVLGRDPASTRV